ncbi:encapsulin-associated ferritin-like protein [Orenia marismortui]|uniref:encapsulin-associated ferritin-like protein n=1 Tax=Orenia marismortui TaxID=46469 RepID=UPI000361622A|nr:ferritin-like domain-containing protein [Orenia marismortui]
MGSEGYHEANLPEEVKEFHRMIQSVIEELEAVDWYNQRAAATKDPQIKAIVEHNRDEEIEHACMGLEWLRRNYPQWDEYLREFLFTEGDITAIEDDEEEDSEDLSTSSDNSLGINNLR